MTERVQGFYVGKLPSLSSVLTSFMIMLTSQSCCNTLNNIMQGKCFSSTWHLDALKYIYVYCRLTGLGLPENPRWYSLTHKNWRKVAPGCVRDPDSISFITSLCVTSSSSTKMTDHAPWGPSPLQPAWKNKWKENFLPFPKDTSLESHIPLLLVSHWPELGQI